MVIRPIGKVVSSLLLLAGCSGPSSMDPISNTKTPKYGAIAISKRTLQSGVSWNDSSREEAETKALRACGQYSNDCRIIVFVRNGCAALAVGQGGWGSAWASSLDVAEAKATSFRRQHAKACKVGTAKFCSGT